jgi:hypothetical protein
MGMAKPSRLAAALIADLLVLEERPVRRIVRTLRRAILRAVPGVAARDELGA